MCHALQTLPRSHWPPSVDHWRNVAIDFSAELKTHEVQPNLPSSSVTTVPLMGLWVVLESHSWTWKEIFMILCISMLDRVSSRWCGSKYLPALNNGAFKPLCLKLQAHDLLYEGFYEVVRRLIKFKNILLTTFQLFESSQSFQGLCPIAQRRWINTCFSRRCGRCSGHDVGDVDVGHM